MTMSGAISHFERRAVLTFALLPIILLVAFFVSEAINSYNRDVADQQAEMFAEAIGRDRIRFSKGWGSPGPGLLQFFPVLIVLSLIRPKRFLVAGSFALVNVLMVIIAIYLQLDFLHTLGSTNYVGATGLAAFVDLWFWYIFPLTFALPLLLWLFTIIWRVHRSSQMLYK